MDNFAIYKTDIAYFIIKYEENYITSIKKLHSDKIEDFGLKTDLTEEVYKQLLEYLDKKRKTFNFPYILKGSDFQMKVWNALLEIPYGETRSYKDIASRIGNEKASRAVGNANNKNPITIAVPCHRVIGSNNKLVGYAGGLSMKEFLLDLEKNNL